MSQHPLTAPTLPRRVAPHRATPRHTAPGCHCKGGSSSSVAKKPRQERERQKERSRVRERRGEETEGNRRKRENSEGGRDEAHRGSFSVRIRNERNLVLRYHVSVTDPIFFLHASIHGYSLARIPCPRCCEQAPAFSSQSGTSRTRYCLCQRDSSRSTRFQPLYRVSSLYRRSQLARPSNRTYLFRVSVASSRYASSSLDRRSPPNIVRVEIAKPRRPTASSLSFSSSSPSSAVARPPFPLCPSIHFPFLDAGL